MEYAEQQEVVIDNERYHMDMSAKQLREACKKHDLPTSGSKKKMMLRLETYRVRLQMLMESELAKKMYEEERRPPTQIKPPKLPSQEEQDEHSLTHWPMATWCEACLATRSIRSVWDDGGSSKQDEGSAGNTNCSQRLGKLEDGDRGTCEVRTAQQKH